MVSADTQLLLLYLLTDIDSLVKSVDNIIINNAFAAPEALPFGVEASWMSGNWEMLERLTSQPRPQDANDFNIGLGKALMAISQGEESSFQSIMKTLRYSVTRGFSHINTASLSRAHNQLFKLHALQEVHTLSGFGARHFDCKPILQNLVGRLDIMGSFIENKEYILCLRRAVMELSR